MPKPLPTTPEGRATIPEEERIDRFARGLDEVPAQFIDNPDFEEQLARRTDPKQRIDRQIENPEFIFYAQNLPLIEGRRQLLEEETQFASDLEQERVEAQAKLAEESEDQQKDLERQAAEQRRSAIIAASLSSRQRLSEQNRARLAQERSPNFDSGDLRTRGIDTGSDDNFQDVAGSVLG